MENNTKTVKLTDAQVSQIYAPYLGQKVLEIPNRSPCVLYHLVSIDTRGFVKNEFDENQGGYYDTTRLLVKSLERISDEDAAQLGVILDISKKEAIKEARSWLEGDWETSNTSHKWTVLRAFDFLRSRGYALPWGPYSVEELVSAGIFKIVDKDGK